MESGWPSGRVEIQEVSLLSLRKKMNEGGRVELILPFSYILYGFSIELFYKSQITENYISGRKA